MALTEKQKNFCRDYFSNGGNATKAYLTAYNSKSEVSAAQEGYRLLQSDDIQEYIQSLNAPLEKRAISEREKKRALIWEGIERCIAKEDENGVARYMDILNKMDSEYVNINRNIEDKGSDIANLGLEALKRLSEDV